MASQLDQTAQRTRAARGSARSTKVTSYVNQQLEKTRRQVKSTDLIGGLLTIVAMAIGFLMLAAIWDAWVWPLTITGRWICLVLLISSCLTYAAIAVLPLLVRKINPDYAAKMIEDAKPNFKNSLLNYVSLRKKSETVNPAVFDAVSRQAATDLSSVPSDATVDRSKLIRLGFVLIGLTMFAVGYKMLSPKDPLQSFGRILAPTAKIAKPAVVRISEVKPGDTSIFFGEQLEITAIVRGSHQPSDVRVEFSTIDGQITNQTLPMTADETANRYRANLAISGTGIQQSLTYRVVARDGASPDFEVVVQPNPTIAVESLVLTPPAYTKLPTQTLVGQGAVNTIEGTEVTVHAAANLPIKVAYIELLNEIVDPNRAADQLAREKRFRTVRSIEMNFEGKSATSSFIAQLNASRSRQIATHYQIKFVSTDDDRNLNPNVYPIKITPDLAPEIKITYPTRSDVFLPENGALNIEIAAHDLDFEIASVQLNLDKSGVKLLAENLKLESSTGNQRVSARFQLKPSELRLRAGDQAMFFATASDNRTNPQSGQPDPNISRTENFTLTITKPEKRNPDQQPRGDSQQPSDSSEQNNDPQKSSDQHESGDQGSDANQDSQESSGDSGNDGQSGNESESPESGSSESESSESDQQDSSNGAGQGSQSQDGTESGSSEMDSGNQSESQDAQPGENEGAGGSESQSPNESGKNESGSNEQPGNSESGESESGESESGESESGESEGGGGQQGGSEGSGGPENAAEEGQQGSGGGSESQSDPSNQSGNNQNGGSGSEPGDSQSNQNATSSGDPSGNGNPSSNDPGAGPGRQVDDLTEGQREQMDKNASDGQRMKRMQKILDEQEKQNGGNSSSQPNESPSQENAGDRQPSDAQPGNDQPGNDQPKGNQPDNGQSGNDQTGEQNDNPSGSDPSGSDPAGSQSSEQQGAPADDGSSGNQSQSGESPSGDSNPNQSDANQGQGSSESDQSTDSQSSNQSSDSTESGDASETNESSGGSNDPSQQSDSQSGSQSNQSGDPSGDASQTQSDSQSDKGTQSSTGQSSGEQSSAGKPSPGSATANSPNQSQGGQPGEPNVSRSDAPTGAGGSGGGGLLPGQKLEAEQLDLEHSKQATDLILEKLADQKYDPDPKLLEEMNWTQDELNQFLDRWQQMKAAAENGDPTAQRRYEQSLKSLDLRPDDQRRAVRQNDDVISGLSEDNAVIEPPPSLAPDFNATLRDLNRAEND